MSIVDISEAILRYLVGSDGIDTIDLCVFLKEEHQKVVGAVKSLETINGLIVVEPRSKETWKLTKEGEDIAENGSYELRIYKATSSNGTCQSEVIKSLPNSALATVGLNRAISLGWVALDKCSGTAMLYRKQNFVQDFIQDDLVKIRDHNVTKVSENQKKELKRRKLLQNIIIKSYFLQKGKNFSLSIVKRQTDLTADMISDASWKEKTFKSYNFDALGIPPDSGQLHPLLKVRSEFRQIFLEMGFTEMCTNKYVENAFWNFDALFQPQHHPARDAHDTFFISDPATSPELPLEFVDKVKQMHSEGGFGSQGYRYDWQISEAEKNVLRTHTTAVSARMLYQLAKDGFRPAKYFSIDKVFRNETLDATHLAEFHQIEGIVAGPNLTLGDLMGILEEFFRKLGILKIRFKPTYNPYTEPSMEIFCYHEGLKKWIEIGNSGLFRPEMLLPMGLPENVNVIAWGLSLERPTMVKYQLTNIRSLVGHRVDLEMVHKNPICRFTKEDPSNEMKELMKNWESYIKQLRELEKQIKSIELSNNQPVLPVKNKIEPSKECGGPSPLIKGIEFPPVPKLMKIKHSMDGERFNIVIFSGVQKPPYMLKVLLKYLQVVFNVSCKTYIHSSIIEAPRELKEFFYAYSLNEETDSNFLISLIWKSECKEPYLVQSPILHGNLIGEVNIGRYLNRIMEQKCSMLKYESLTLIHALEIDSWLDKIHNNLTHGNLSLRSNFLNSVNKVFASKNVLVGKEVSIADICLWSAIKHLPESEIPNYVFEWCQKFDKGGNFK